MPAWGRGKEHISGGGGENISAPLQSSWHSALASTDYEILKYKILIYELQSMPAIKSCHPEYLFLYFSHMNHSVLK